MKYLNIDEVAERIYAAPTTIYGWRVQGIGPPAVKVAGRLLFVEAEVDAWVAEQAERQRAERRARRKERERSEAAEAASSESARASARASALRRASKRPRSQGDPKLPVGTERNAS